ncbi:hypothetical protein EJ06DRAFT_84282 [Trichodelitschia bisporula]|uniref:C2H2-type domain-containing protein n=1 Tax=Trichodelitschia bisporula TaxID=703511 RepID=A0A6G1HRS9_9PEZI|nr:hypothetical protein EJ06DRAFT_84282 [Trichodelitschia bisporula]
MSEVEGAALQEAALRPGLEYVHHDVHDVHEMHELPVEEDHEPFSPRRGYTHKRAEDPPKNENGKFVCKFTATCGALTFDRRCEWRTVRSKHMDKHDRPYKCEQPGCEKLQGFTYSGGLLRHQREVHKMHGGTKKALYCPEPNCKRNAGSGFTRKENLSEHIRRVHRRATSSSDGFAQPNTLEHQLEVAVHEEELDLKRRREDDDVPEGDLRDAVKRLRTENLQLQEGMKNIQDKFAKQQALLEQLMRQQTLPQTLSQQVLGGQMMGGQLQGQIQGQVQGGMQTGMQQRV